VGVARALPLLGAQPFFVCNADIIWLDGARPALIRLAEAWDAARMDALLLLEPVGTAFGYEGPGDFFRADDGRLQAPRRCVHCALRFHRRADPASTAVRRCSRRKSSR
jgi:hypothetical protein